MRTGLTLRPVRATGQNIVIGAIVICWLIAASTTWAGEVTDQLKVQIDKIISVLNDPTLKSTDKKEDRRKRLLDIAGESMDLSVISQRALGRYWNDRTPEERQHFTILFGHLLMEAYLKRVDAFIEDIDGFSSRNILYKDENRQETQAVVTTDIVGKGNDKFEIAYLLALTDGQWRIVDIAIEGVSIVKNYHAQFQEILSQKSYKGLISTLEAKKN